jgi:hypothetical protein
MSVEEGNSGIPDDEAFMANILEDPSKLAEVELRIAAHEQLKDTELFGNPAAALQQIAYELPLPIELTDAYQREQQLQRNILEAKINPISSNIKGSQFRALQNYLDNPEDFTKPEGKHMEALADQVLRELAQGICNIKDPNILEQLLRNKMRKNLLRDVE